MLHSRKFVLTLIGVGCVMFIAIGAQLLKRFADVDLGEIVNWAMVTIAASVFGGQAMIAYEDVGKAKATGSADSTK